MSPAVQPSPALVVPSDTAISECVRKMRDHEVGSLLIVSYTDPHHLVGIFTERDLLKWIDELQLGGHWDKPVAHLMSKNVETITVDDLDRAAEIMLKGKFRHLPVTNLIQGRQRILGVLSMRDLFSEQVRSEKRRPSSIKNEKKSALFLTSDMNSRDLDKVFTFGGKLEIQRKEFLAGLTPESVGEGRLLLMDLDGVDPSVWATFLQKLKGLKNHPPAVIFFDPRLHPEQHVQLLRSLSSPGSFEVFAKPFNVIGFMSRVRDIALY
ncbi:MAG: CBS domain-containing protein [Bdellovibrionales bacterium]|nr:CBS domain-containing protein [Bdellovibrionales bacterium]